MLARRQLALVLLLIVLALACRNSSLATEAVRPARMAANVEEAAATTPIGPGRIAFIGTDRNIYLIDPDGENLVQLTDDAAAGANGIRNYSHITWSPNSANLAFVQLNASRNGTAATLLLADPISGELTELFQSDAIAPFYLHFAPDSQALTFLSADLEANSLGLYLIPTEPAEPRVIENGQPFYWAWSPDSAEIFVHIGGRRSGQLAFINPADDSRADIDLQPTSFQAPTFTPNGEQLVVAIENESGDELAVINRDGTIAHMLARLQQSVAFILAPTGEHVAFITSNVVIGAGAVGALSVVPADGSAEALRIEDKPVISFFWSPDGQKLAYIALDPNGRQRARPNLQDESEISFGLYIYDVQNGQSRHLHSFEPTGELLNVIPYFDQYHLSSTFWSPDSRYLAMSGRGQEDGSNEIVIIDVSGEESPRRLTTGVLAFWSWQ